MKNILLTSIFSIGLLSACTQDIQNNKPTESIKEPSPSIGEVVSDSLENITESDKEPELEIKDETKEEVSPEEEVAPIEPTIVEEKPSETINEDTSAVIVLKTCEDLVSTITKNQSKIKNPFGIPSTYQRLPNNESKVIIGFEATNISGKNVRYLGSCTFDSENKLSSFSADPIKE